MARSTYSAVTGLMVPSTTIFTTSAEAAREANKSAKAIMILEKPVFEKILRCMVLPQGCGDRALPMSLSAVSCLSAAALKAGRVRGILKGEEQRPAHAGRSGRLLGPGQRYS